MTASWSLRHAVYCPRVQLFWLLLVVVLLLIYYKSNQAVMPLTNHGVLARPAHPTVCHHLTCFCVAVPSVVSAFSCADS
jgi:hypothetical protein